MPGKDGSGPPTGRGKKASSRKCNQPGAGTGRKRCLTSKKRRATQKVVPS